MDKTAEGGSRTIDLGSEPDMNPDWVSRVQARLLEWYMDAGRALPWRIDRDAYKILVSEFMLVQTTVVAVMPFFDRFLRRFPDIRSLAEADEAEVLKTWEGLGYYRRARHLHAAAQQVVREHEGTIPNDPAAVRAYLASAVISPGRSCPSRSIGRSRSSKPTPSRILARLLALKGDVKSSATRERLWEAAERLVPLRRAGDFNQALMDLGALICTPRQPRCLLCPLNASCRAREQGLQEEIPISSPKPPPALVTEACAVVSLRGKVLIVQRAPGRLWERFWEFPTIHVGGANPAGRSFGTPVEPRRGNREIDRHPGRSRPASHGYPI